MSPRSPLPAILLALVALAGPGCGAAEQEEPFADGFNAVNERLLDLNQRAGGAIRAASRLTDEEVEREFGRLARMVAQARGRLAGLDPPADLVPLHEDLVAALGEVQTDLSDIERAAAAANPRAAKRATEAVLRDALRLRRSRRDLAHATGARIQE